MEFNHIVEVGCDGKASLHHFITPESRVQIFECNPNHLFECKRHYGNSPNVQIHPFAMWKENTRVNFMLEGATSHIEGLQAPCVVNDGIYSTNVIEVEARTFDQFDDGTIDIMDIDIEGAEWYVIERLKSRPKVIVVEMAWGNYINPHFTEIQKWMKDNFYYKFQEESAAHFYRRLA